MEAAAEYEMSLAGSGKIARSLVAHGVDTLFGIPGAHMYDFNDALYEERGALRFIHTRHEQGAGYMAYGYAKSTGRTGAYTVVPGPGLLNSSAALCTAYAGNAPVFCITGNIMSHLIGQGRGQLHESPDQLATLRGLTRAAERIDHPAAASAVMADFFPHDVRPTGTGGGGGAVGRLWAEKPRRNTARRHAAAGAGGRPRCDRKCGPDDRGGEGAAHHGRRRCVGAGPEIAELARRVQAPVTAHRSGKGILPDDDPMAFNLVAAFDAWKGTDLLIGIGSRLELQYMRWRWQPKGLRVIRIDIDPTEMVRLKPDVGIVADAKAGTRALIDALTHASPASRTAEFADRKARARKAIEGCSRRWTISTSSGPCCRARGSSSRR